MPHVRDDSRRLGDRLPLIKGITGFRDSAAN
jgi:hypothetical protein